MVGHASFDYSEESAIITGSTKGIGRGIAEELARTGANVAINSRTVEDVERAVAEMNATHDGEIIGAPGDVSVEEDVKAMVRDTVETFGSIDLLVNNAATWPQESSMMDASVEAWDVTMDVNVRSQFYASTLVAEHMVEHGIEGNIINVTSQTGDRRCGGRGLYGVSNTTINGLTWRMAHDYAQHGIRVNAISTSATESRQLQREAERETENDPNRTAEDVLEEWGDGLPIGRLGRPEDVGHAVLFLASEKASYVVGEILRVSGGGNLQ